MALDTRPCKSRPQGCADSVERRPRVPYVSRTALYSAGIAPIATALVMASSFASNAYFPCYIIPNLSTLLNDVEQCLTSAIAIGVILAEYRAVLETHAGNLARMRIESHRSPGFFQQIVLAFRRGFHTQALFTLVAIGAVKMRVELAMDERRLALLTAPQIVVSPLYPVLLTMLLYL
ncbi:hypothetical protein BJY52DRAFT_306544 [Lactarius psammicola]|nr:hypothetical protein BJY52DRAFT_306544 [Lactarius psammicola]